MFDAFPSFEQTHRIVNERNASLTKTFDNFVGWVEVLFEIKKIQNCALQLCFISAKKLIRINHGGQLLSIPSTKLLDFVL